MAVPVAAVLHGKNGRGGGRNVKDDTAPGAKVSRCYCSTLMFSYSQVFVLLHLHSLGLNRHTLANTSDVFQLVLVIILQLMPAPGVK